MKLIHDLIYMDTDKCYYAVPRGTRTIKGGNVIDARTDDGLKQHLDSIFQWTHCGTSQLNNFIRIEPHEVKSMLEGKVNGYGMKA